MRCRLNSDFTTLKVLNKPRVLATTTSIRFDKTEVYDDLKDWLRVSNGHFATAIGYAPQRPSES